MALAGSNNKYLAVGTDLELCSEPELNDLILVELTPDVQHAQDHWVHQQLATTVTSVRILLFDAAIYLLLSFSLLTLYI